MTYKLINQKTKEEFICSKVQIDGFDYYVSGLKSKRGWFYCSRTNSIFKDEGVDISCCQVGDLSIVATSNPLIDLPKVIVEVDLMIEQEFNIKHPSEETRWKKAIWKDGYSKCKETFKFNEEDMIDFLTSSIKYKLHNDLAGLEKTPKELLTIWQEKQVQTIYFE